MVSQMSSYLLSLMLVLFVVGQMKVKGEKCSLFIAGCLDTPACDSYCKDQWSGGIGICSNERCICNFECGGKAGKKAPKRDCNASTGPCSKECGDSCCNNKCASKYNQGVGYCRSLLPPLAMCQCVYAC
ncbi:Defensin fusion [Medicago truncatula]|uniref:Defensin-like protein n=2 Tax=Medicago truncatula TaxID=3880 RepID=Q2HRZ6_MEDTR|nr:hypothetical protein MtrDRAFT_AC157504g27v2 [Medicago truncatula]AES65252.1 Defensin fusion [Medicago truncatula]